VRVQVDRRGVYLRLHESMSNAPSILVIQPEGTFKYNVNLTGLAEMLSEHGYVVGISAPQREFNQSAWHDNIAVHLWTRRQETLARKIVRFLCCRRVGGLLLARFLPNSAADFYLGVDRMGILIAATLARAHSRPYGLLSYEIMFAKETSYQLKRLEISACRGVTLTIVQDATRGAKLSQENAIPAKKLIYVPVAGRGTEVGAKGVLRKNLGIPSSQHIACYMGSIAPWTMIDEMLASLRAWPRDWCLVIHDRFARAKAGERWHKLIHDKRLYLSTEPADSIHALANLLGDVDLGLSFYKPLYTSPYLGDNLRYIGLASGKTSTYFQYGIPVVGNTIDAYVREPADRAVAIKADSPDALPGILAKRAGRTAEESAHCHALFSDRLSLERYVPQILRALKQTTTHSN
jgi:hypothetical protein